MPRLLILRIVQRPLFFRSKVSAKSVNEYRLSQSSYRFLLGSYYAPGDARTVTIVGNIAYVADGGSGLWIIDVSNPQNPILEASAFSVGDAMSIAVS